MRRMLFLAIVLLAFVFMWSCATGGHYLHERKGNLSIVKRSYNDSCQLLFKFTNVGNLTYKPNIEFIAFDSMKNTLDQSWVYFDLILPEKSQIKSHFRLISCNVDSIVILQAISEDRYLIEGVKGKHTFGVK